MRYLTTIWLMGIEWELEALNHNGRGPFLVLCDYQTNSYVWYIKMDRWQMHQHQGVFFEQSNWTLFMLDLEAMHEIATAIEGR